MPGRIQFSIRLLLLATAAIAAAFAAASPEPTWQSCVALEFLAIVFASIAVTAALKSRGGARVFWFAAAAPALGAATTHLVFACIATASASFTEPEDSLLMVASGLRVSLPVIWCLSLANGFVCCLVHGLAWPSKT